MERVGYCAFQRHQQGRGLDKIAEYELAGGKTHRMLAMGFSPRKPSLVLYIKHATGWDGRLARLGKHGAGTGCLYINKLADVDFWPVTVEAS